jgi:uncharacterized LabA/DUF88 family protein
MKAGIFLDIDNLTRHGGLKIRFEAVTQMVQSQGAEVLRANAYMAVDKDLEARDPVTRLKRQQFRDSLRRAGYHLVLKPLRRFVNGDGQLVAAANCILELAVDAVLQSAPLDYVLIGSGDGDTIRLIRALQERGKRVDVLTFGNASSQLQRAADNAYSGFLVPGLLPSEDGAPAAGRRFRGQLISVDEESGVGRLAVRTGMGPNDIRRDVQIHLANFTRGGSPVAKDQFAELRERGTVIEFDLADLGDGRAKAINAREFRREDKTIFLPPIEDET